jgi:hypothetical protein
MIEIVVDSDSHVPEEEEEEVDEERMQHWWWWCWSLRKTVERATPLAAAVSSMVADSDALSEIAAAFVGVRKAARIAAALLLPLRYHEIC